MNTYIIDNKQDNQKFIKEFKTIQEAKNWVINTLDLSKQWSIAKTNKLIIVKG